MKKVTLWALAAILSGAVGCKPGTEVPGKRTADPTLEISRNGTVDNDLTIDDIPAAGGAYTVTIDSNRNWEYIEIDDNSGPDHNQLSCIVSPKTGPADKATTVTITVSPNTGGERSTELEFRTIAGTGTRTRTSPVTEEPVVRKIALKQLAANQQPEPQKIEIETARMEYVFDKYKNNTGSYWLSFQFKNEDGTRSEINLECISTFNPDLIQARPDAARYDFATSDFAATRTSTFSENSEFIPDVTQYQFHSGITAGSANIEYGNGVYKVDMALMIGSGDGAKTIAAGYEGPIHPIFYPEVSGDTVGLDNWDEVTVDRFKGSATMWEIVMKNSADNTSAKLLINAETDLALPPVGNFPMAATPRAGVAGTAEPASIYGLDDYDWGCWYWGKYAAQKHIKVNYPDVQYAVTNNGSVDISKAGDVYTFAFTFAGPDGRTVSGSCQKEIAAVDTNSFAIEFTSAKWSVSGNNYTLDFFWDGAANGEKLGVDLYVENGALPIADGTYNFNDGYDVPWTFSDYGTLNIGVGEDWHSISPDGGKIGFTKIDGGYKVDFNIHFEDGRTLKCTYNGPITAS